MNLKKSFLPYLATLLIGNVSSTQTATFVSTDFVSAETLAPILISKTRKLGVVMSAEMSKDCKLSFNDVVTDSTVSLSEDLKTIYFTPLATGWPVKLNTVLFIKFSSCRDSKGNLIDTSGTGAPVYIADTVTYVDTKGSDSQDGKDTTPVATITKGIEIASQGCSGACALAVKGGEYILSSNLIIPTNVSIFGGFDPSDWKKRRADKTILSPYDTIITDTSVSVNATDGTNPYSSIKFTNYTGSREKTFLDGISINGPISGTSGSYISPIGSVNLASGSGINLRNVISNDRMNSTNVISTGFVSTNNNGYITIYNCTLNPSVTTNTLTTRYGIVYNGSSAGSEFTLAISTINSGTATLSSSGFFPTSTNSGTIFIAQSSIYGPSSSTGNSVGVTFNSNGTMAVSESIISASTGANSYGVEVMGGTSVVLSKNTITSAQATTNSGGIGLNSAVAVSSITENTITGGIGLTSTYGIYINNNASSLVSGNTITTSDCASCTIRGIQVLGGGTTVFSGNNIRTGNTGAVNNNRIIEVTNGTNVISGNTLNGGSGFTTSSGIEIGGGSIVIDSNTINGPSCSASTCTTSGIRLSFGNPFVLTNNTVVAGTCSGMTCTQSAVLISENGALLDITGNTLDSGNTTANTTNRYALSVTGGGIRWGVNSSIQRNTFINRTGSGNAITVSFDQSSANSNNLRFCSNVIKAGNNTNASASVALEISNATSVNNEFMGNTYIGGSTVGGNSSLHRILTANVVHDLEFNIFHGDSSAVASTRCITEFVAGTSIPRLSTNSFSNCSTFYFDNGGTNSMDTFCGGNFGAGGCGVVISPAGIGNLISAINFMNPTTLDYHLNTSTTSSAIYQGVVNPNGGANTFSNDCGNILDRDGNSRTINSAIGAYR
ncbi:MAG: hypothetical protein SFU98_09360 [Leptospiraceae bacterium]|nr:hypothetical protein [Leptospiraceae bacterium]